MDNEKRKCYHTLLLELVKPGDFTHGERPPFGEHRGCKIKSDLKNLSNKNHKRK
jgi:hypothetical protein